MFATNALGHYALAGELLTTLASASGRLVWLGSMSTTISPYDPIDPQLVDGYTPWRAYVQSKVATSVLGFEADRRLRAAGVAVSSVVAHPGYSTSGRTHGDPRGQRAVAHDPVRRQPAGRVHAVQGAWRLAARAGARRSLGRGRLVRRAALRHPRSAARRTPSRVVRSAEIAERIWGCARRRRGCLAVREGREGPQALSARAPSFERTRYATPRA